MMIATRSASRIIHALMPYICTMYTGRELRVQVDRREVQVSGRRVGYAVAGVGEPVVLVHGLSGSTRWWRPVLPRLADHYRVYLLDLPGFGAMARRERFSLSTAASWLSAWLETVGLEQTHLIGHSMGGYVSIMVAATAPRSVQNLVLVDAAGVPVGRSLAGYVLPLTRATRYMSPGFIPVLASDALRAGPLTLLRAARALVREDVRRHLASIIAPTLIIWGGRDTLVPLSAGELLRREIPDSRLVVLEGAGHVPMYDRPDEFSRVVLCFLRGEPVGR